MILHLCTPSRAPPSGSVNPSRSSQVGGASSKVSANEFPFVTNSSKAVQNKCYVPSQRGGYYKTNSGKEYSFLGTSSNVVAAVATPSRSVSFKDSTYLETPIKMKGSKTFNQLASPCRSFSFKVPFFSSPAKMKSSKTMSEITTPSKVKQINDDPSGGNNSSFGK